MSYNSIDIPTKYSFRPVTTPDMYTTPISGYNVSGSASLFNSQTYTQNGYSAGYLSFPCPIYVKSINFGSVIMGNNTWYSSRGTWINLYYNGKVVLSVSVDPCAYIGRSYVLSTPVLADTLYRNVGGGSAWQASASEGWGGDAYPSNSVQGCTLSGIMI